MDRKACLLYTSQTYNFLVALAFSQMFNLLCERADNVHGGRLPHHVRVLWDEAANPGQVPQLEKLVAVIRSREVSLCLLYQQLAQCKASYDKHAETILGNMDSVVFLLSLIHIYAKSFDRVARKWNVDYAFYKTGPDKYLLFFKAGQADAMTACFSEYSRKVLSLSLIHI